MSVLRLDEVLVVDQFQLPSPGKPFSPQDSNRARTAPSADGGIQAALVESEWGVETTESKESGPGVWRQGWLARGWRPCTTETLVMRKTGSEKDELQITCDELAFWREAARHGVVPPVVGWLDPDEMDSALWLDVFYHLKSVTRLVAAGMFVPSYQLRCLTRSYTFPHGEQGRLRMEG